MIHKQPKIFEGFFYVDGRHGKIIQKPFKLFLFFKNGVFIIDFVTYTEKVYKILYKTLKECISSNVADLFNSKGTWRALEEHLGIQGTRALEYLAALRHLNDT